MRQSLPKLEYPVTRRFTLPYLTLVVCVLGLIWITLVTLVNVAAVGYDVVTVYSTSFNPPSLLWYEKRTSFRWLFPPGWSCNPASMEPGQGLEFHMLQKS